MSRVTPEELPTPERVPVPKPDRVPDPDLDQNKNTTEPDQPDGETQATDQATDDHSSEEPPDSDQDTVSELPESLEEAREKTLETLRKQRRRKSTIALGYQENLPVPQIRDIAKHNVGLLPKVLWVMLLAIRRRSLRPSVCDSDTCLV